MHSHGSQIHSLVSQIHTQDSSIHSQVSQGALGKEATVSHFCKPHLLKCGRLEVRSYRLIRSSIAAPLRRLPAPWRHAHTSS